MSFLTNMINNDGNDAKKSGQQNVKGLNDSGDASFLNQYFEPSRKGIKDYFIRWNIWGIKKSSC